MACLPLLRCRRGQLGSVFRSVKDFIRSFCYRGPTKTGHHRTCMPHHRGRASSCCASGFSCQNRRLGWLPALSRSSRSRRLALEHGASFAQFDRITGPNFEVLNNLLTGSLKFLVSVCPDDRWSPDTQAPTSSKGS